MDTLTHTDVYTNKKTNNLARETAMSQDLLIYQRKAAIKRHRFQ